MTAARTTATLGSSCLRERQLERVPVGDRAEELDVTGDLAHWGLDDEHPSLFCHKPCSPNSPRKAVWDMTPRGKYAPRLRMFVCASYSASRSTSRTWRKVTVLPASTMPA